MILILKNQTASPRSYLGGTVTAPASPGTVTATTAQIFALALDPQLAADCTGGLILVNDNVTDFSGLSALAYLAQIVNSLLQSASGIFAAAIPAYGLMMGVSDGTNIRPTQGDTLGNTKVVGNVASAGADSGNPVKVGGVYRAATQTFTDGQRADLQMNLHGLNAIDTTTTDVSGTFTATGTTAAIDSSGNASIAFTVNVSAASGTTPTLDVQLQASDDGVNDWISVYDADRFTATGTFKAMRQSLHARYYRFRYAISGTTPSFTFTVRTTLKVATGTAIHVYNRFNDLVMTASNNFSSIANLEGCAFAVATLTRGAGGAGVAVALQESNDGVNWVTSTSTNTSASNSYVIPIGVGSTTKYARFTNTNNQAAATTLDIKWYAKE